MTLPEIYHPKQRPILKADPTILALPTLGPQHFYETGRHVLKMSVGSVGSNDIPEDEELGRVLVEMISKR